MTRARTLAEDVAADLGGHEASGLLTLTGAVIVVQGHAEGRPGREAAERLGLCRAQFVADLLIAAGVDPARLAEATSGAEFPAVEVVADAYENRRVIVSLHAPPRDQP